MRVLHVLASLSPRTGGPSNVLGLARALVRQGLEVTVCSTDLDETGTWLPWHPPQRISPARQRRSPDEGVEVRFFRANWPSRFGCSWTMAGWLARHIPDYDIVHIHSLYLFHGLIAGHLCRRAGVPYVIRPHGTLDEYHRRHHRLRKRVYDWLIESRNISGAAALHYTSKAEQHDAVAAGVRNRGFVVGLGVDVSEYLSGLDQGLFRASKPELQQKRLIVFLGRVTPKKGLDLLIPAFAEVSQAVPDVHLVLAGPDDEGYAAVVRDLIAKYGVGEQVTWAGLVTGKLKVALLSDADAWVLPSYDENFAVAAVEAMAAGAPIVITDRVGIHEQVSRAQAGLVVEPTVAAVRDGLLALLQDENERRAMGERARRLALTEFSWDTIAAALLREYQALRSPPSQRASAPSLAH